MFAELQLSGELRLKLAGAVLTGACIDQSDMSIALRLTTRAELGEDALAELKRLLMGVYGFRKVDVEVTCKLPVGSPSASAAAPSHAAAPADGEKKGGAVKASKILMGKPIKTRPGPMRDLDLKMGNATVAGKVFAFECRETRRPGMWRMSFDMTDYTSSVTVQKNLTTKEAQQLEGAIAPGMWLMVQGKMEPTWDGKDIQLNPYHISVIDHVPRQDTAKEKRVELHLHTKMSNMDALTDTKEAVKTAIRWGHPAIAITDHGVAQSFPDAWHAAGDKIKLLYGVEGYFVNNIDDRVVVHGTQDCPLDGEFVCFDIETTGLKVDREAITEIGAVVLRNGEICERFQTFVNPNRRLTPEIIGLTGITDDMLKDAPQLKQALTDFLKFVNGRPLAAHNAEFDIGFIRAGCKKVGLDFQSTYVDSLILAQNLLPDLHKYKLDIVAEALDLPAFNHHRASDDAATVGYMLIPFWKMLHERGIHTLQAVNKEMEKLRPLGSKTNRFPKHIILIARNKVGLKNLYQMISASNLKYFKRVPTIPKSLLVEHREGIIVGSACEAGELFKAVTDHKDWDELKRIASFYDYLEIQPLCNNAFMLRNGDVQSEEELKEFIANISHELKTPMTTIAGYTDGILDGTIPPENERQYLQIISNESRRLSRLVRRMLDVSQLQVMDPLKSGSHFDICESMRRVLISMEKKITDRHLDVDADIPEEPILVRGDNDMITQVIYNLLENATKFAREGTTLYLGVTTIDGKARVTVRNLGDTIPAEELPLLFERFHKSDKSRSEDKDGVGLGLYIVKTILEQHKEKINVTSENGVTTFAFSLSMDA